jgi:antitoxin ParD1/3/4
MNVSLTPQLESMIRERVESGRYTNASEVVGQALRLLEVEERKLAYLREKVAIALEQEERGEVHEDTDEFWETLTREAELAIARGDTPDPDVCP